MGNCLMRSSNRVLAEDVDVALHEHQPRKAEESSSSPPLKLEAHHDVKEAGGKGKKKTVRFRLHEEEEEEEDGIHENGGGGKENINNSNKGDSKSGVVRIKVVLSRQELKQIVMGYEMSKDNNKSHISCVEELLNLIKSRGTVVGMKNNGSWRPALESIAEERSYS